MTYVEAAAAARGNIGPHCKACPVCDGRGCMATIPGPGAKGSGTVAMRNYDAWQQLRVNMDTIHEPFCASTATTVLGQELSMPLMIAPVGDVKRHYGEKYEMSEYNRLALGAAVSAGTLCFTGDGVSEQLMVDAAEAILSVGGRGVPTVKPWDPQTLERRIGVALSAGPVAVAMDIDAAGLPFLRNLNPPAGSKTVSQLREVADLCHEAGVPFVLKGVMGPRVAEKAAEAGVDAIVVSNHGGRVLDGVPATATVLPSVADAVGDSVEVLVDGGIRSGLDVFRALALGARAALVCRPAVVAIYGAGQAGAEGLLAQYAAELADTMEMCGAATVQDITRQMLWEL